MTNPNLNKLKQARDSLAEIYESEVKSDSGDYSFLKIINDTVVKLEEALEVLKRREK